MKKWSFILLLWGGAAVLWLGVVVDSNGKDSATVSVVKKSPKQSKERLKKSQTSKTEDSVTLSDTVETERRDCININSATQERLVTLPGVGPVIAQRIIDNRKTEGPFKQLSDVERVKGIGPKTVQKMADAICF